VYAFYPNKQITTGEGGLIVTDSRHIYDMCRSLRNQGRSVNSEDWFGHSRLGYNYRISDINCALGLSQLNRIEEVLRRRRAIAAYYQERLKTLSFITPPYCAPNVELGWFVYVVRLSSDFKRKDRDAILKALRDKGVACSNYFAPIHLQPFYRKMFGFKPGDFPVTEDIAARTLALPFFNAITNEQIDYVVDTLKSVIKKL
jgi:perosamine synthetase